MDNPRIDKIIREMPEEDREELSEWLADYMSKVIWKGIGKSISAELKEVVDAADQKVLDQVVELIEEDPHVFSKRPCKTCNIISSLIGRPFGCLKKISLDDPSKGYTKGTESTTLV